VKKYKLLLAVFLALGIISSLKLSAKADDSSLTFPSGGTVEEDFPGTEDNPLGVASVFHIFAEEAELDADVNGNVAVADLVDNISFGTKIHEGLVKKDVSYIQNVTSIAASSFVADQEDRTNKVIFGKDVQLGTTDNGNALSVNGTKMDHLKTDEVYQDTDTEQYIDFDKEFEQLNTNSNQLTNETPAKTVEEADFSDQNNRVIDVSNLTANENNQIVIDLKSDVLATNTPLTIKGLSKSADAPMMVFNVETGGQTYDINSKIVLEYTDGTSRSNHETEDFSDAHVLWNFENTQNDQEINFNAPFQGSVLAPNADLTINQNLDGNIVGKKVSVKAETHRWDLQSNSTTGSSTSGTTTTGSSTSGTTTTGTTATGSSTSGTTTTDTTTTGSSTSETTTTGTTATGSSTTGTTTTGSSTSGTTTTGTTTTGSSTSGTTSSNGATDTKTSSKLTASKSKKNSSSTQTAGGVKNGSQATSSSITNNSSKSLPQTDQLTDFWANLIGGFAVLIAIFGLIIIKHRQIN
jgi:choice-of-anchor A domain-containing protein